MKLRGFKGSDLGILRKIHRESYPEDNFPDISRLRSMVVIMDDNEEVISFGGIELIAEGVVLTDKIKPALLRGKALLEMMDHMEAVCLIHGQNVLHAFVSDDPTWSRALLGHGFKELQQKVYFKKV